MWCMLDGTGRAHPMHARRHATKDGTRKVCDSISGTVPPTTFFFNFGETEAGEEEEEKEFDLPAAWNTGTAE